MEKVIQKHDERERKVEEKRDADQASDATQRKSSRKDKADRKAERKAEKKQARINEAVAGSEVGASTSERLPPSQLPSASCTLASANIAAPPPISTSSAPPLAASDLNTSIRILEECRWRVILEHGTMGDVVAIAAFAPGPGGDCSTPNTPATPSNSQVDHAFDLFRNRTPRSAGGGSIHQGNAFMAQAPPDGAIGGGTGERNLWINNSNDGVDLRARSPYQRTAATSRTAWANNDGSTTPPISHGRATLPLRRGAPAALYAFLHVFGIREFEVHLRCKLSDLTALAGSVAAMIALVSQIGLTLIHWADVIPLHMAISAMAALLVGWLSFVAFLQTGHVHRVLSTSADALWPGHQQPNVHTRGMGGRATLSDRQSGMELPIIGATDTSSIQGPILPEPFHHTHEAAHQSRAMETPPVAMMPSYLESMRRRVRLCAWAAALTVVVLGATEWYWVVVVRIRAASGSTASSLTSGGDGALWLLGVGSGGERLTRGQHVLWGLISLLSSLMVAGSFWAPFCCIGCVVDAHVHLAAQLRAEHSHLTAASAWDSMALAQLVEGHIEVARQTSSRLSMFSSVWLIAFGYTCISGLLDTAVEGPRPAVICTTLASFLGLYLLFSCLGAGNERHRDHLRGCGRVLLIPSQRHMEGEYAPTIATAAYHAVAEHLAGTHGFGVLGVPHVTSKAADVILIVAVAALALSVQVGLVR